jgi:hypothetical protein
MMRCRFVFTHERGWFLPDENNALHPVFLPCSRRRWHRGGHQV